MEERYRERSTSAISGKIYERSNPGGSVAIGTYSPFSETTRDFWKKEVRKDSSLPPSDFRNYEWSRSPIEFTFAGGIIRATQYPVDGKTGDSVVGFNSLRPDFGTPARQAQNNSLALELLTRTNPFREEYSVPVAIKELLDVASLFKLSAGSFAGFLGGSYLNYKFGWVQFVNDIKTLHSITTVIERRIKEFDSLTKKGGLRRCASLPGSLASSAYSPAQTVHSTWGFTVQANVTTQRSCKIHGTVRWRVKDGYLKSFEKLNAFNLAVSKVFDLGQLDSQTMWNLVPFSWLVDYFYDLNSYFGAQVGAGIVEPYDICIIRTLSSRIRHEPIPRSGYVHSGIGQFSLDGVERDVVPVGSITLPSISLLNRNQILTLVALIAAFKR